MKYCQQIVRTLPAIVGAFLCTTSPVWAEDLTAETGAKPGPDIIWGGIAGASCGGTLITQNTDPDTITDLNTVRCAAGGVNTDNFYARSYFIANATLINCVDFAIQTNPAGGAPWPIRVRLYDDTNGGAPNFNAMTLLAGGEQFVTIPSGTIGFFTATFPGGVLVPAGTTLVVELLQPCRQTTCPNGGPIPPGDGFANMIMGSNNLGQSGPTYIATGGPCGLTGYVTLASIGFPNVHIIQRLGTSPPGNPCTEPLGNCPEDIAPAGGNGTVNVGDLLAVIGTWGQLQNPPGTGPRPLGDVRPLPNGNCMVNVQDLLGVISKWGLCTGPTGACCFPDGTCQIATSNFCTVSLGGKYQGNGVPCSVGLCPAVPVNDDCDGAINLVGPGPHTLTNANATDGTAPEDTCDGILAPGQFTRDVWYTYTAECTGSLTVDLCDTTAGSFDDSVLQLFTGPCESLVDLVCDDDGCGTVAGHASATTSVDVGQVVFIRVGSWTNGLPTNEGEFIMNITCVQADNDNCTDAEELAMPASVSGSLVGTEPDEPNILCGTSQTTSGRWYTVVGTGKFITAATCSSPAIGQGPLWNAQLSVFCGANCPSLICVDGADDNTCAAAPKDPQVHESVTWCGAAGQRYWILVHTDTVVDPMDYTLTVSEGAVCTGAQSCGPPNDECAGATAVTCGQTITVSPADYAFYTSNPDDPITRCEFASGGPFPVDRSWWYTITTGPSQTSLRVTMCNITDATLDTVLGLFSGTCEALTEVKCDDDFCTAPDFGPSEFCAVVQPNTQYFILVKHYEPEQINQYQLTIDCTTTCSPPCSLACTGTAENETCGANTNGGCNSNPNVFQAISSGQVICGTTWAENDTRDTDWYTLTVGPSGSVTINLTSETPVFAVLFSGTCAALTAEVATDSVNCVAGTINDTGLTPGSTVIVAVAMGDAEAIDIFNGFPCGSPHGNDYRLVVTSP